MSSYDEVITSVTISTRDWHTIRRSESYLQVHPKKTYPLRNLIDMERRFSND